VILLYIYCLIASFSLGMTVRHVAGLQGHYSTSLLLLYLLVGGPLWPTVLVTWIVTKPQLKEGQ
jgi:hypothetical protein